MKELKESEHVGFDVPLPSAPPSMGEPSTTSMPNEHVSGQQTRWKRKGIDVESWYMAKAF